MTWALAATVMAEFVPIEWPGEGDVGPTFLPSVPAPTIRIPRLGDLYTWNDVGGWFGAAWQPIADLFGSATSGVSDAVQTLVGNAIGTVIDQVNAVLATVGGMLSATGAYFSSWITSTVDGFNAVVDGLDATISRIDATLGALAGDVYAILTGAIPQLWDTVRGIEDELAQLPGLIYGEVIDGLTGVIQGIVNTILGPIVGAIEGLIGDAVDNLKGWVNDLLDARVAALLAALAALGVRVSALEATADECVQPMCDTFGPKTDLGKLFKTLAGIVGGALTADLLSGLTYEQLQDIAQTLGGFTSTNIETSFERFVAGGTVGGVVSGVTHQLTDEAKSVLGDLGVPGF